MNSNRVNHYANTLTQSNPRFYLYVAQKVFYDEHHTQIHHTTKYKHTILNFTK